MNRAVAIRLVKNIRWKSIDKDNMEFTATVSCYQRDALNQLLAEAEKSNE